MLSPCAHTLGNYMVNEKLVEQEQSSSASVPQSVITPALSIKVCTSRDI